MKSGDCSNRHGVVLQVGFIVNKIPKRVVGFQVEEDGHEIAQSW
jgi:hypothetical protein